MADDRYISQRIEQKNLDTHRAQRAQEALKLSQYSIAQESAAEEFKEWGDLNAWNPMVVTRNFQNLDKRVRDRGRSEDTAKAERDEDEDEEFLAVTRLQEISEQFQRKNDELQSRTLLLLRSRLKKYDDAEAILKKVRDTYHDLSLADETLDFLIQTSEKDQKAKFEQAKKDLNSIYEREIKAGRNMGIQAREFSSQGLGSPNALRNLYRDITGNPRDAATLFNELSSAYPYEKMKTVINFLLHSMGADMKAKGPSISPGELARLLTDVRSMQGILGIYQFFKTRMRMILSEFKRAGLNLPPGVTFETLAKLLVKFLGERYPSVDKALKLLQQLGLPDRVIAQIIILMQLRDAIRQIAPKLFKDDRHRQDVLLSFMETLEELEEELEEDDNGKPKKDKKKG